MTIEEKLELHSTITSLPISDDKLHRINELMNKAYDEMEQKGREKAIEEAIKRIPSVGGGCGAEWKGRKVQYDVTIQVLEQIKEQTDDSTD